MIRRLAVAMIVGAGAAQAASSATGFDDFLVEVGLPGEALDQLETARAVCPECPVADGVYLAAGEALARHGEPGRAAEAFTVAAEHAADPAAGEEQLVALGGLELALGRDTTAERRLVRLEQFAASEAVRRRAGRLLAAAQRHEEAVPGRVALLGGLSSALLPGLGQLLGGEPAAAGGAFTANAVWGAWCWSLAGPSPADALLVGTALGWRYYAGNIARGADAMRNRARGRNDEAFRAALAEALGD